MDTNQANNYQINSFTKGMNSDTAYDQIGSDLYLFGKNIRITNNTRLLVSRNQNTSELIVSPIYAGKDVAVREYNKDGTLVVQPLGDIDKILACDSIGNAGCVVARTSDKWRVYRVDNVGDTLNFYKIYEPNTTPSSIKDRFSITMLKEVEGVVKVYIADGINPVTCIFLQNDNIERAVPNSSEYYDDPYNIMDYYDAVDDVVVKAGSFFPYKKPIIRKAVGNLKTLQVQYCYRYYLKYGYTSKISPLTNKLHVISSNRNLELGNAEDTETDMGFNIMIPIQNIASQAFTNIQIFRISYIKYGQQPQISLICDQKLESLRGVVSHRPVDENPGMVHEVTSLECYFFHDDGIKPLKEYSIEEFLSLNGISIIPQTIEQSNNYLFSGNCKDLSVISSTEDTPNVAAKLQNSYLHISSGRFDKVPVDSALNVNDYGAGYYNAVSRFDAGTSTTIARYLYDLCIDPYDNPGSRTVGDSTSWLRANYSEPIMSSVFRSNKYEEDYDYGIVFYDKYGRRTEVKPITLDAPLTPPALPFLGNGRNGLAYEHYPVEWNVKTPVLGLALKIKKPESTSSFVGFEVVRRAKDFSHTKKLMLVALSRPLHQGKYGDQNTSLRSPYYPNVFLSSQFFYTLCAYHINGYHSYFWDFKQNTSYNEGYLDVWNSYFDKSATNTENFNLFQIFSSRINVRRNDVVSMLSGTDLTLAPVYYFSQHPEAVELGLVAESFILPNMSSSYGKALANAGYNGDFSLPVAAGDIEGTELQPTGAHKISDGVYLLLRHRMIPMESPNDHPDNNNPVNTSEKIGRTSVFGLYDKHLTRDDNVQWNSVHIKNIKDVKNPNWEDGFSNVQTLIGEDSSISTAILKYKSYNTNIGQYQYNNWVSNGMYDLAASENDARSLSGNRADMPVDGQGEFDYAFVFHSRQYGVDFPTRLHKGWIGPGPVCLLIATNEPDNNSVFKKQMGEYNDGWGTRHYLGTLVCDICHNSVGYQKNDPYYGFGNYFELEKLPENYSPTGNTVTDNNAEYQLVNIFDGDMYHDNHEFVNLFKTYDFNDHRYTLQSGQVVYYIPMVSDINVHFDYGCNYRNTGSDNLMLEPGQITGVASLGRPLHLYNMIYSDNEWSINVFYEQQDELLKVSYPTRIHYSQLKTNGENIDNWLIVKAADFIDADTRFGGITNLLSKDNTLYYWQERGFGKLSVNERSLVKDENSETILLGQGGVLNRVDYISEHYGMQKDHFSAVATEDAVFWVDVTNKAILMCRGTEIANYGETLNVQNVINGSIDDNSAPIIKHDVQSDELMCKCLNNGEQLVFNTKYGMATSVYTRSYDDIIQYGNTLIGLSVNNGIEAAKYNYLNSEDHLDILAPIEIAFVVNSSPSQTKVFDNQKVVVSGDNRLTPNTDFLYNKGFSFETDIYGLNNNNPSSCTNREGNILFDIPRFGGKLYGGRMRGKWMKETITDTNPDEYSCISHVITKFRQSYS